MSGEPANKKFKRNVTLVTLSDDDDNDDEVKIVEEKKNIPAPVDEEVKVLYEKERVVPSIKTVDLCIIDDTKSDVSFGTDSRIKPLVEINETSETCEKSEAGITDKKDDTEPLETNENVEIKIKNEKENNNNDISLEKNDNVKKEIKDEKVKNTRPLQTSEKNKTDNTNEKDNNNKPEERNDKIKITEIKDEKFKDTDLLNKVKVGIKEEKINNISPLKECKKIKIEIKDEKIDNNSPIKKPKKIKTEIIDEKKNITKIPKTREKLEIEIKDEKIVKKTESGDSVKENSVQQKIIKDEPSNTENKRKSNCGDKKYVVLQENIKVKQQLGHIPFSNRVVNPIHKKFRSDTQNDDKSKMTEEKKLDGPSPLINSSDQLRICRKRMNIMFTGINYEEYKMPLSTIGGKTVDNPSIADVLVTDQIRRKFKFTLAIAQGIPIVSLQWIKSSITKRKFEDPLSYIIKDVRFERDYNIDLRDSLIKSQKKAIFDNYTFIITRNVIPKFSDLHDLIKASGGVALMNAPKVWKEHTFIISCEDDLPFARRKKINSPKKSIIPIINSSCIIDAIWKQRFEIKDYLLSY